jgi:transcriptional regulator with XRE-family HTH domain
MVDHTQLDRSASYISALETGRTSPTLEELEKLARYFRVSVIEFLEEAAGENHRRSGSTVAAPEADDRVNRLFGALTEGDQELTLEFMELLAKRKARR